VVTPDLDADEIELTEAEIKERMSGNLCRCGAYDGIVGAIQGVAR
jgi:xanthine dehydrogenase YagT iron-sulfur-binding subunit